MCRRFGLRFTSPTGTPRRNGSVPYRCDATCGDADELQQALLELATQECGYLNSAACRKAKTEIIEVPFRCWHQVEGEVNHAFRDLWETWLQVPRQHFYQGRWQIMLKMNTLDASVQECLDTFFERYLARFRTAHMANVHRFIHGEYLRRHPTGPDPQVLYRWIDLAKLFGERIQLAKFYFDNSAVVKYKARLADQPETFKNLFQGLWFPTVDFTLLAPSQHTGPRPQPLPATSGRYMYPDYYRGHAYYHPPPRQNPYGSCYGGPARPAAASTFADAGRADTRGSSTAVASGHADYPDVYRPGYHWDNPYRQDSS